MVSSIIVNKLRSLVGEPITIHKGQLMSLVRDFAMGFLSVFMCGFVAPARADVTYQWVTTSVTNLDPEYCGTAACEAGIIKGLDAVFSASVGGPEQIVFTDETVAAGEISTYIPADCRGCATPGIVLLPGAGEGAAGVYLNFADSPYLSGAIDVTGYNFSYDLSGSGLDWHGAIDGDDPFIGELCVPQDPLFGGCSVTGYWVDPPALSADAAVLPEPSSAALAASALLGLQFVLWRRRRLNLMRLISSTSSQRF